MIPHNPGLKERLDAMEAKILAEEKVWRAKLVEDLRRIRAEHGLPPLPEHEPVVVVTMPQPAPAQAEAPPPGPGQLALF